MSCFNEAGMPMPARSYEAADGNGARLTKILKLSEAQYAIALSQNEQIDSLNSRLKKMETAFSNLEHEMKSMNGDRAKPSRATANYQFGGPYGFPHRQASVPTNQAGGVAPDPQIEALNITQLISKIRELPISSPMLIGELKFAATNRNAIIMYCAGPYSVVPASVVAGMLSAKYHEWKFSRMATTPVDPEVLLHSAVGGQVSMVYSLTDYVNWMLVCSQ